LECLKHALKQLLPSGLEDVLSQGAERLKEGAAGGELLAHAVVEGIEVIEARRTTDR